jgi:hypothetical protein
MKEDEKKAKENQLYLLDLYYPELDPEQYEDTRSDYYKKYHNKFKQDKIQSLYNNYKDNNDDESPPRTIYNDKNELMQGDKKLVFSKITPLYLHRKDLKNLSSSNSKIKIPKNKIFYLKIKYLKIIL